MGAWPSPLLLQFVQLFGDIHNLGMQITGTLCQGRG
jgi:hypothetical protein